MNDLDTWDQLLRLHVDQAGRVDYAGWLSHHPHTLSHWLAAQTAETDGRQEHLAHWINLYNAFTIQAVLKAYPIASIRPTLLSLPNWIGFLAFFQRKRHRLANQWISLAWIENRMLRQQGIHAFTSPSSARHWAARCCATRPTGPCWWSNNWTTT